MYGPKILKEWNGLVAEHNLLLWKNKAQVITLCFNMHSEFAHCSFLEHWWLQSAIWSFQLFYGEFWSVKLIETRVLMKPKSMDLKETHKKPLKYAVSFLVSIFKLCFDGSLLGPCCLFSSKHKNRNKTSKQKSAFTLCTILLVLCSITTVPGPREEGWWNQNLLKNRTESIVKVTFKTVAIALRDLRTSILEVISTLSHLNEWKPICAGSK